MFVAVYSCLLEMNVSWSWQRANSVQRVLCFVDLIACDVKARRQKSTVDGARDPRYDSLSQSWLKYP